MFLYDSAPNSPELSLLRLAYHHSHFLAAILDFTFFLQQHSWGKHTFFTAKLFWIRFHFFLYFHIIKLADYMLVVIFLFFIGSSVKSFDVIMYMYFTVLYLYKICA